MTVSAQAAVAPRRAARGRVISAALSIATGACALTAWQAGPVALAMATLYALVGALIPETALLILAAGAGITATAFGVFLQWPGRMADVLPLAVLCGIHGRDAIGRERGATPSAVQWAAIATLAVLAASVAVQFTFSAVVLSPAGVVTGLRDLARTFLDGSRTFSYLVAAVQFATCVGLYAATAAHFRVPPKTDRLVRMLIAGGSAVAALDVARLVELLLRTGEPITRMALIEHVRISVTNGDPNAMGSLFAMLTTLAMTQRQRECGMTRHSCTAAAVLMGAALWMTGSRTALVALLLAALMAAAWKWRTGWRTWAAVAAVAGCTAVASFAFPNSLVDRSSVVGAANIRAEMARVAVRLWKTDPTLGVGVGQFLVRSGEFIEDPYVRQLYGRENAHNNFLQILAELGVVGAAASALLLIAAFWSSPPAGIRLALFVFLLTCLAGHPLLVPEVAFVFALVAGSAAAYVRPQLGVAFRRTSLTVIVAASVAAPISYRVERNNADLEHLGYGVTEWRQSADGRRYRRSDGDATVFVPLSARELVLEIRPESQPPLTVALSLDGRPADHISLSTEAWLRYAIVMPSHGQRGFVALRLRATDRAGHPAPFDIAKITALQ